MSLKQPLDLYWKNLLVGQVSDAAWSDFPWVFGKVTIFGMPADLRDAMEYLHRESHSEDGVCDWPFPEEFVWDWRVVDAEGESVDICQPIIDFEAGEIEWC